jgi:ABC-type glycerol-3-phosphate transport system permease component
MSAGSRHPGTAPRRRPVRALAGALVGIAWLLPLLWVLANSLRPGGDIFRYLSPLSWRTFIPTDFTIGNYVQILGHSNFGRSIVNSVLVSVVTVIIGLALAATSAFALSAIRFRGQNVVFAIVVISFLLPFEAIAIPLASLFRDWHLQDSYPGLILPGIGGGLAIFVLRQFFLAIPRELVEAAQLDGLGWWGIFARIYLPNSKPALVGAGLTLFFFQWQSYLWPLLIGTSPARQVAPIALANLNGQFHLDYGQIFAGAVLLTLVPLALILRFQRHFTQSIASSGLKG